MHKGLGGVIEVDVYPYEPWLDIEIQVECSIFYENRNARGDYIKKRKKKEKRKKKKR